MKKKFFHLSDSIDYARDTAWYSNTYYTIGSDWLVTALLKAGIKTGDIILSPAANCGNYEHDVLNTLDIRYHIIPEIYLSDICKSKLNIIPAGEHLHWIVGDGCDASDIYIGHDVPNSLPSKANFILDIKGATWHTIYNPNISLDKRKKQLLKLLRNYESLLRDNDSLLFLDYYELRPYYYAWAQILCLFDRWCGSRRKLLPLHYFQEDSTFEELKKFFPTRKLYSFFHLTDCKSPRSCDMNLLMDTVAISRSDLTALISFLDHRSIWAIRLRQFFISWLSLTLMILPFLPIMIFMVFFM